MIGEIFIIKKSQKRVKILKTYNNTVALCLDIDNPKTIFWHREIDNKYIIKIFNLEKCENFKQVQSSLF